VGISRPLRDSQANVESLVLAFHRHFSALDSSLPPFHDMKVTDLVKKLRQYEEIGTIASVRIEFGEGSIYNGPPLGRN